MKTKKTFIWIFLLALLFPSVSMAQTITFENPLDFDTVEDFLTAVWTYLQGIIITLSIIFIIIGGILYMVSAGDNSRMTTAKGAIFAAIIGLAIAIAAPTFLIEIADILDWNDPPDDMPTGTRLSVILTNALNFLLGIVGTIAVIMMVVGGLMYLTSAGDEDRMKTGKKIFIYSIIGITVALASMVIVRRVALFFS